MIVRDQLCISGAPARPNEDIGGALSQHGIAWVIDGATGLTKSPLIAENGSTDAQWFSHTAHALLQHTLQQDTYYDTTDSNSYIVNALSTTLTHMIREFGENKKRTPEGNFEEPCASLSILHSPVDKDNIHCFILGDCPILIENGNDDVITILGDKKHAALDTISCAHAKPYLAKGLPVPEVRNAIKDTLRKHRNMMNTKEGYWIFSLTLDCLKHIRHYSFPRQNGAHALIMSDGFYALVDKYERYTNTTLIETAKRTGLPALYNELRFIETEEDPLCQKHTRLKQSDDATAILLQF